MSTIFELETVAINFKEDIYVPAVRGYDIIAHQNDILTLNFQCWNGEILEDMTNYQVELRIHNNDKNVDYIQTQGADITKGNGFVQIKCTNKLTEYSGLCQGILRIFNVSNKQKSTKIITMNVVADPIQGDKPNISESTITKLDELNWVLNEAYKVDADFGDKIREAVTVKNDLGTYITNGTSLNNDLKANISTGTTLNNNLKSEISTGSQLKTDLNTINGASTTLKNQLNSEITTGTTLNNNLKDNITDGNVLNTDLGNKITTGNKLKDDLTTDITTATTKKTELETATTTANTAKTNLDNSITTGDTTKANLDTANTKAETNITELNKFGDVSQIAIDVTALKKQVYEDTLLNVSIDNSLTQLPNVRDGFVDSMVIKGKTRYKKADGTYTDTFEDGVTLESTGESEGNKISILTKGKNLLNLNSIVPLLSLSYGVSTRPIFSNNVITRNASGEAQWVYTLKLKPNTTYNISCIKDFNTHLFIQNWGSVSATTSLDGLLRIILYFAVSSTPTTSLRNLQLEEGTTATSYESYKEDKTEILLPNNEPLRGLPNGVVDTIDVDKTEITRNVGKVVLNGSENWSLAGTQTNVEFISFYFSNSNMLRGGDRTKILSDKFPTLNVSVWDNPNAEGITTGQTDNAVYISIRRTKLSTPDLAGFKAWLQANPTTVYYQMATPVVEKLDVIEPLQTFQDGYVQLDNSIAPNVNFNYSVNLTSVVSENVEKIDELYDQIKQGSVSNQEIIDARDGKTSLNERLNSDKTNLLNKIGDTTQLPTNDKTNVVNSIKEINTQLSELTNNNILSITNKIVNSKVHKTIKILGDSIGAGRGGSGYSPTGEIIIGNSRVNEQGHCWANSLKDYLETKYSCTVKNWSVSGWNSSHIVTNIQTLIKDTDDIVICAIGANNCYISDGLTKLESDIEIINNYCINNNKKIIFIGTIQTETNVNETLGIKMEDIDNKLREVTTRLNACFVPLYKLFNDYLLNINVDYTLYYTDDEHPNDNGYDVMFYLIANYVGIYTDLSLRQKLTSIYDTGWLPLPLTNGVYGDSIDVPSYRRIGKLVSLKGTISNITNSVINIATLPQGFTPNVKIGGSNIALVAFWTDNDTPTRISVNRNGIIGTSVHNETKSIYLDGVNFSID